MITLSDLKLLIDEPEESITFSVSAEYLAKDYVEKMRAYKMQLHMQRINRMIEKFADAYHIPHRKHVYWKPMKPFLPTKKDIEWYNTKMLSKDYEENDDDDDSCLNWFLN